MITVQEATSIILANLFRSQAETVELHQAGGRILAEPILADRDFPPFDRVTMDGIAINCAAFREGKREFPIEGVVAAGTPQQSLQKQEDCLEVMTGALLPVGANAVVRYEDLELKNGVAKILIETVNEGENIHRRKQDAAQGDKLLYPGIAISASEVALLASIGKSKVKVQAFPRTAIISTGDELVGIDEVPLPHQIRRSNDTALQSALKQLGCPSSLHHVTDVKEKLEKELKKILDQHDLIILSGGVSKGKFDFIPQVLESLGVKKLFHQVSQKPGKPFWFGTSSTHTVFALPGNPVSTYMCFYRYIKPWLQKSLGTELRENTAVLAQDYQFKPPLTYFLQVKIKYEAGRQMAYPDTGGGSGDFVNLKDVDGFLELPLEGQHFKAGEAFPYIPFRKL